MEDAQDLKSWERKVREGSTPSVPTNSCEKDALSGVKNLTAGIVFYTGFKSL